MKAGTSGNHRTVRSWNLDLGVTGVEMIFEAMRLMNSSRRREKTDKGKSLRTKMQGPPPCRVQIWKREPAKETEWE